MASLVGSSCYSCHCSSGISCGSSICKTVRTTVLRYRNLQRCVPSEDTKCRLKGRECEPLVLPE